MNRIACSSALAVLFALATTANAQVFRCGDGKTYSDQPCAGATNVDVRSNVLNAGPRFAPADVPAPAVIPAGADRPIPVPDSGPSNIWQQRDNRDADQRNRTVPYPR